jgi:hypothetical protein
MHRTVGQMGGSFSSGAEAHWLHGVMSELKLRPPGVRKEQTCGRSEDRPLQGAGSSGCGIVRQAIDARENG